MKTSLNTLACALGLALVASLGLPGVALGEDRFVAIKAKTVITATGDEFSPGVIVLRNGKVEAVGAKVALPPKAIVIDAPNEVVMPGFVLARSLAGRRRGGNSGHMSLAKELYLRPGELEGFAKAGFVAVALSAPGSGITGQALVLRPIDGKLDELTLHGAGYLRVTMTSLPGDKVTLRGAFTEAEKYIERIAKAKKAFEEAQKKAAAAAAAKKKAEQAAKKKKVGSGPKPAPKPVRRPVPGPRPQPRPRPIPRRAPLDEAPEDGSASDEFAFESEEGEQGSEAPLGGELTPEQEAAKQIGHDHDDPNAGKEPAAVGIDPFAPAKPKRGAAPKTFKAPKSPERVKIFMAFVKKPESGLRVLLELNKASAFLHYEDGFKERKLDPAFYLDTSGFGRRNRGETDLYRIAGQLGKAQARVLLRPALTYEPHTRTQRNIPQELLDAGCVVAFSPSGTRPDGYLAEVASLVRAGFDRTKAIQAMTSRPAELLGLGSEIGTLKKGYLGDLTFLSGDPFAPGTRVTRIVLGGEEAWSEETK